MDLAYSSATEHVDVRTCGLCVCVSVYAHVRVGLCVVYVTPALLAWSAL